MGSLVKHYEERFDTCLFFYIFSSLWMAIGKMVSDIWFMLNMIGSLMQLPYDIS